MKIELTSPKEVLWFTMASTSDSENGISTGTVERGTEQWQLLLNARVHGDDGKVLDEYTLAVDMRGKLTLERKDVVPFLRKK